MAVLLYMHHTLMVTMIVFREDQATNKTKLLNMKLVQGLLGVYPADLNTVLAFGVLISLWGLYRTMCT